MMRGALNPIILVISLSVVLCGCARKQAYSEAPVRGGSVSIDASKLKPNSPFFYSHSFEGKRIDFFVIKLDGGEMLSFFDACETCYKKRLGYRADANHIVCRACNLRFPYESMAKGIGNCYPVKLDGKMEGNNYMIPLSAVRDRAWMFR